MALKSIGFNIYGREAFLEKTAADWWLTYKQLMGVLYPDIALKVVQARGGAAASAGTHSDGWAVDLQTWHLTSTQITNLVTISRKYGGVAWLRTQAQGFDYPHVHIAIDSGGIHTACQYQVAAAKAGYSGLGRAGRGSRDTHPAPAGGWKTAARGVELMQAYLSIEEDPLMSANGLSQQVKNDIAAIVAKEVHGASAGSYGTFYQMCRSAADGIGTLRARTAPIRRGGQGDPNEYVAINQEIADAKTLGMRNAERLDKIEAQLAKVLEILTSESPAR